MVINIVLGILLILIIIYFLALVLSLRMRNQQAEKVPQWNDFRDLLVIQAQRDREKAHRKSLSIQKKYKDLGAPYVEDRDQAIAILGRISDNARTVLNDRKDRPSIPPNTEPFSWKTFFINPLWAEYRNRQHWWQTAEKLGARLSRNPSGFSAVEKLEKRLSVKGLSTQEEFETLKNKTDKLIQAFQTAARSPTHFQDQIQELALLDQQIDQTTKSYLTGGELSPKQVATAASKLTLYQQSLEQLNQTLKNNNVIRRDTRSHLDKNQALIDTLDELLRTEEEADHPITLYRESLNAEIKSKQEQEQKRETGTYLQQPAQEQHQRLQELEKNLRVLIQERKMLSERLERSVREITLTEAWIKTVKSPFIIDQTDIILEQVQQQQYALYQLIQSTEDLDLLSSQIFIDPQKLASHRTAFDQQVKIYQTLHQKLDQQIPPVIEQVRVDIQNLQPLNSRYHKDLNLDILTAQAQSLEDSWNDLKNPSQIIESRIDDIIADLGQLEISLQEINRACRKAEEGFRANAADREDARQLIENPTFVEYHQVMQVISREYQIPLSDRAGDYARQAEELNILLEQIDTDFDAVIRDTASLLTHMKKLWSSYKQQYAEEKKEYQALADKLIALQISFEKYQKHELLAFRTRVAEPASTITNWLQSTPVHSIQDLRYHVDQGYEYYKELGEIAKELSEEYQNYVLAKDGALSAIAEAKTAIDDADKTLNKIPWGPQSPVRRSQASKQRNPALEHSYRYLDSAEIAYKEITDPENEYYTSVEKAVSDLRNRVRQQANHAKAEAGAIQQEIREQIDEINQKCEKLEKTLADGDGYSSRLADTGIQSQWGQIYRKYSRFEEELERQFSYREAFSYLEQALIESRYQIERMREFGNSA